MFPSWWLKMGWIWTRSKLPRALLAPIWQSPIPPPETSWNTLATTAMTCQAPTVLRRVVTDYCEFQITKTSCTVCGGVFLILLFFTCICLFQLLHKCLSPVFIICFTCLLLLKHPQISDSQCSVNS